MKTAKLITGGITTLLGCIVFLQSCGVSIRNSAQAAGENDLGFGLFCALILLTTGILGVYRRNGSHWLTLLFAFSCFSVSYMAYRKTGISQNMQAWCVMSIFPAAVYVILHELELFSNRSDDDSDTDGNKK